MLPARGQIQLPRARDAVQTPRDLAYTDAEFAAIVAGAAFPQKALYALLGYTGLRINEALALTWRHVDLDAQTPLRGWIPAPPRVLPCRRPDDGFAAACQDRPDVPVQPLTKRGRCGVIHVVSVLSSTDRSQRRRSWWSRFTSSRWVQWTRCPRKATSW